MINIKKMPSDAREKLLFVAMHLFSEKGFKETSVLEIVEKASVSKTTFYQHFKTKEILLIALLNELIQDIHKEIENTVNNEENIAYKAYAGIRRYLELCLGQEHIAEILLVTSVGVSSEVENKRYEAHRRFAQLIYQTVQGVIPEGISDEHILIVSQAMVGAINEVVVQNLSKPMDDSDYESLAHLLNRIVVGSFVNLAIK